MCEAPEVSQCYSVAGTLDFILVVHAANHSAYEKWGEEKLMADARIRRYDSHIAWSRVKFTTAIH
ncbi:MAG: DNA-binding Lrp family transcriptional regulator [Planctomycetota bacterium]|jgi:DNA-binding Lrp family transcriptional regulator